MRAQLEVDVDNPDQVIKTINPDIDENQKFSIQIKPEDKKIILTIESKDISGLLAGINSYLRLIKISKNV